MSCRKEDKHNKTKKKRKKKKRKKSSYPNSQNLFFKPKHILNEYGTSMGSEKKILIYLSHCLHKLLQFQTSAAVRPVPVNPHLPLEALLSWLMGRGAAVGLALAWSPPPNLPEPSSPAPGLSKPSWHQRAWAGADRPPGLLAGPWRSWPAGIAGGGRRLWPQDLSLG